MVGVSAPPQSANGYVPKTKLLILGIVLTVWGVGIVVRGLASPPQGSSAYVSGQRFAIVFGLVMLIVGARQLWLEYRARRDATT